VRPSEPILDVGAGGGHALAQFNVVNPIVALDLPGAMCPETGHCRFDCSTRARYARSFPTRRSTANGSSA
jgi:hypothetical protein